MNQIYGSVALCLQRRLLYGWPAKRRLQGALDPWRWMFSFNDRKGPLSGEVPGERVFLRSVAQSRENTTDIMEHRMSFCERK